MPLRKRALERISLGIEQRQPPLPFGGADVLRDRDRCQRAFERAGFSSFVSLGVLGDEDLDPVSDGVDEDDAAIPQHAQLQRGREGPDPAQLQGYRSGRHVLESRVVPRGAGPGGMEQLAVSIELETHDRPALAGAIRADGTAKDRRRHEAVVRQRVQRRSRDARLGREPDPLEKGAVAAEHLKPELREVHDADAAVVEHGQALGAGQFPRALALVRDRPHMPARRVDRDDVPGGLVEDEEGPVGVERQTRHVPERLPRLAVHGAHGVDGLHSGRDRDVRTVESGRARALRTGFDPAARDAEKCRGRASSKRWAHHAEDGRVPPKRRPGMNIGVRAW